MKRQNATSEGSNDPTHPTSSTSKQIKFENVDEEPSEIVIKAGLWLVGLTNNNSYCYTNSVLQFIKHSQSIREIVPEALSLCGEDTDSGHKQTLHHMNHLINELTQDANNPTCINAEQYLVAIFAEALDNNNEAGLASLCIETYLTQLLDAAKGADKKVDHLEGMYMEFVIQNDNAIDGGRIINKHMIDFESLDGGLQFESFSGIQEVLDQYRFVTLPDDLILYVPGDDAEDDEPFTRPDKILINGEVYRVTSFIEYIDYEDGSAHFVTHGINPNDEWITYDDERVYQSIANVLTNLTDGIVFLYQKQT